MATTYSTAVYANRQPPASGAGMYQATVHMHAVAPSISTWAVNDTINFFSLPRNAVVMGVTLKAQSQLDSNGSPTLTFDVGIAGTLQLFMAASALVGRAAGASSDIAMAAAGRLYKNTTGADLPIVVTAHAAAATAVAGVLELEMSYFVEDTVGSAA
jgi:hypothetical protein